MRGFFAFVVALFAVLLQARPAEACENATIDDPAVDAMRDADKALWEGDVVLARDLAGSIVSGKVAAEPHVKARAVRIDALTWIRDPRASKSEIDRATETLKRELESVEKVSGESSAMRGDLGEAYARAGRDDDAYQMLSKLHAKDLVGEPYAYAALARVSAKRGDQETAAAALKRCGEMTSDSNVCRGVYPPPPLLHGRTAGYALPGALAMIALVRRRRVKNPWSTYGDKLLAAVVVATCAFVFAFARAPVTATLVTFAVLVLTGIGQRVAFLAAVKRSRIAGWVLRDATAEDARLPTFASFFHSGHRVLEREPDPSYREPARVGVMHLSQRSAAARSLALAGLVVVALLGACTTFTLATTRSSAADVLLLSD